MANVQRPMENSALTSSFWQGKKVFLTGHTGFKGGWLSLWLRMLGADVTGFALPPSTHPNLFEAANVAQGIRSIMGDIRDEAVISQAIRETSPDIVIHMAAQALVRYSYSNPVETYATNVMGTVHLFEALRKISSVRAVVNVTSDKCYANKEWVWGYRENEPLGGIDPYSSSKACAELVTSAFRDSFFNAAHYDEHGVALASARAGNVIGGGDWALDRLLPDILKAISTGHPVVIRSPQAIRPWQHVLEPLSGYLLLAQRLYEQGVSYAEGWNFGPYDEDARPVQWIVERVTQNWGHGASWQIDNAVHPHEAHYLKLDCSKARARLGWRPHWNLVQALDKTVAWHRAWLEQQDMRTFTINQIQEYIE